MQRSGCKGAWRFHDWRPDWRTRTMEITLWTWIERVSWWLEDAERQTVLGDIQERGVTFSATGRDWTSAVASTASLEELATVVGNHLPVYSGGSPARWPVYDE